MKYRLLLGFFNNKHKYLSRCRLLNLEDNTVNDKTTDEVLELLRNGNIIEGLLTTFTTSSRILKKEVAD